MTADPDGLEQRPGACGLFDAIVQKPIHLQAFLKVIASCLEKLQEEGRSDAILKFWRSHGLDRRLRARIIPDPERRFHSFLNFDEPENLGILLIADASAIPTAGRLRTRGNLFTLPFVDVTGRLPLHADASLDPATCSLGSSSRKGPRRSPRAA